MQKISRVSTNKALRISAMSAAVAGALVSFCAPSFAAGPVTVKGVVAGSYFTPPVISDNPNQAQPSSTAPSVYAGVTVCFDANNNGVCDAGEVSTTTNSNGEFVLSARTASPIVAQIPTTATNGGNAVTQRNVFRVAVDQVNAAGGTPLKPANVPVTPLSTEVVRMLEADNTLTFATAKQNLASRLGVAVNQVLADPNTVTDAPTQTALLKESVVLTNRFGYAAKIVDRGDVADIKTAEQVSMNVEGIPRYDNIFIIMLENKATSAIKNNPDAPKINAWLNSGNQFISYFATGNPSEPNYTALGGADDFGITDDSQWNCGATGANSPQDQVIPSNTVPGLAKSPFTATCTQSAPNTNHNIVGRPNLFNALTSNGLTWRTYNESMNPGQDPRIDSVADSAVTANDNVYPVGTLPGATTTIGNASLVLPLPAQLYRTKHHPGMAYQNVRSAPEFFSSNRTLGGGQWDANLLNSTDYAIPAGYNVDQFGTDLQTGDIGAVNFVIPDQCDDMHGITVKSTTGVTASDCASVANNVSATAVSPIIARGDKYVDNLIKKIQASPLWQNPNKRMAIVIMFDEGNASAGSAHNSCCGWNPGVQTVSKPLIQNADGSISLDTSIPAYYAGNRGHGESVFGVLTNQPNAPKGLIDSDYYSHFSFVHTLQDMFQLADPAAPFSYMNRSKYTESFIAANILNLPEYAGSADTHFDSVRPMNHAYVFPAGAVHTQSADVSTAALVGPDATQTNLWSLK